MWDIRLTDNRSDYLLLRSWFVFLFVFGSGPTYAEYFSVQNGRIARFDDQPTLSVEAGYSFGDFGAADYKQLGVRLNYLVSPDILIFGDIGRSDINSNDQTSYGAGVYYAINEHVTWSNELAVKLSYHQVDFEGFTGGLSPTFTCTGPTFFVDPFTGAVTPNPTACMTLFLPDSGSNGGTINNIVLEVLTSGAVGETFAGLTTNWYISLGLHTLGGDIDGDQEFGVGGGFVFPFGAMELYTGFEYVDESTIGFGARYSIK